MNIIKHGNTYHEVTCPDCKASLGFLNKEIIHDEENQVFGDNWSIIDYINCPECGNRIILKLIINGENIPTSIL